MQSTSIMWYTNAMMKFNDDNEIITEERYRALRATLQEGKTFKGEDGKQVWKCRNCGYIYVGKDAPELCPCCAHPRAYFEKYSKNY